MREADIEASLKQLKVVLDYMYAPWRSAYFSERGEGCVFCAIGEQLQSVIMNIMYCIEMSLCFIVMNRYPYTPGHFMVIPHMHTDALEELPSQTWMHISFVAQRCVHLLKEGFGAQGANLGMNLGKSGGAGIAEHISIIISFHVGLGIQILLQP